MSQRECSGFNWPPPSIRAAEPVSISPETANRAGPSTPVTRDTVFRPLSLLPASLYPFCAGVPAIGVGQPDSASFTDADKSICALPPSGSRPVIDTPALGPLPPLPSDAPGVGQPASCAITCKLVMAVRLVPVPSRSPMRLFIARCASTDLLSSFATGVGHPPQPLSDVRRADAASREIDRPAGVTLTFQVIEYKVEPRPAVRSRNLLAKDDWRIEDADKLEPGGPEVALVAEPATLSGGAEGLARAAACPDGAVVRPSGEAQGVGPHSDPGEEMQLGVSKQIDGIDVPDIAFIHIPRRDVTGPDKISQPLTRERIQLVIVGARHGGSCDPVAQQYGATTNNGASRGCYFRRMSR